MVLWPGGTFERGCPGADDATSCSIADDGNAFGCWPDPTTFSSAASLLGSDLSTSAAGMPP